MSIEEQMHVLGIVLGWIIVAGYLWSVMNYFVKRINREWIVRLPEGTPTPKAFSGFMRAVTKSHTYVPLFLLTIMLLHFLMELIHVGFFISGVIAIGLLTTQIALGIYGKSKKDKKTAFWLYAHRSVAVLLFFAISVHVVTVVVLKP
ncbi:MAG: hypothetical protein GX417_10095 [Clostridiales bacterium]|nr:hypothetical protein [Clostridiales bacterium]